MATFEVKQIITGFRNLVKERFGISDEEIEALYDKRIAICNTCESKQGSRCGECGCLLEAKGRSPQSECPLKKW